jgi:hypothetical protein
MIYLRYTNEGVILMMFVEVYRRIEDTQVLGNGDGQGNYKYKTMRNFEKHVLNNPSHILFHTYRDSRKYIRVVDENGKEIFTNKN